MLNRQISWSAVALVVLTTVAGAASADWTRFRGPNGAGVSSDDKPTPVRWSKSENLKWQAELPGAGVSSPIVVGNRVFVTSYSGYGPDRRNPGNIEDLKRHLSCFDRNTGELLWNETVDAVLPEDPFTGAGVPTHGYASHTPTSDGENVYVFFGKTGALAFDMHGKQLWQTRVGNESDPRRWGSSSSPILYKNLVIVTASAESEAIVALDKQTGKEVWRQEAAGFSQTWSTPILVKVSEDRTDLVIAVPHEIWGLNPETGKFLWYCESIESEQTNSSVVDFEGVVYAVGGRNGGSIAIRAGGKSDVSESHVVWSGRDSNRFGTPIVHEGRIYVITDSIVSCIDAKTGDKIFQSRLQSAASTAQNRGGREESGGRGGRGRDYSSPVLADDKLYFVRYSGDVVVLKAGTEFEQLAVNTFAGEGENFMATPAISQGELFIRSNKKLYCIGQSN